VTTGDVKAFAAEAAQTAGKAMALYGPADAAPTLETLQSRLHA